MIKDVRIFFRSKKLKKESNDTTIKDVRYLFRSKKEIKVIKDLILRDIRNIFEHGDIRKIFDLHKIIK